MSVDIACSRLVGTANILYSDIARGLHRQREVDAGLMLDCDAVHEVQPIETKKNSGLLASFSGLSVHSYCLPATQARITRSIRFWIVTIGSIASYVELA